MHQEVANRVILMDLPNRTFDDSYTGKYFKTIKKHYNINRNKFTKKTIHDYGIITEIKAIWLI